MLAEPSQVPQPATVCPSKTMPTAAGALIVAGTVAVQLCASRTVMV